MKNYYHLDLDSDELLVEKIRIVIQYFKSISG